MAEFFFFLGEIKNSFKMIYLKADYNTWTLTWHCLLKTWCSWRKMLKNQWDTSKIIHIADDSIQNNLNGTQHGVFCGMHALVFTVNTPCAVCSYLTESDMHCRCLVQSSYQSFTWFMYKTWAERLCYSYSVLCPSALSLLQNKHIINI